MEYRATCYRSGSTIRVNADDAAKAIQAAKGQGQTAPIVISSPDVKAYEKGFVPHWLYRASARVRYQERLEGVSNHD